MEIKNQNGHAPKEQAPTTRPVLAILGLTLTLLTTWLYIDYALEHPDASGRAILLLSTYSALAFSWLLGWLSAMRREGPFRVMLLAFFLPPAAMLVVYFSGLFFFG